MGKDDIPPELIMRIFVLLSVVSLVLSLKVNAQQTGYPKDTSYTFESAYEKYAERYPEITPVKPVVKGSIEEYRDLVYKNTGKRNLHLDIYTPQSFNQEKLPAVLMIHGGGWVSGDKSLLYFLATHLAERGFVTVNMEYRLSPEAQYPAAVYDIKTAIKWIKEHAEKYAMDEKKVVVLGTSAGGQLAALVGTTAGNEYFEDPADTSFASTQVQAIVDIDGVLAFIHPESEEGEVASKWLGGDQEKARETWIEASALTHVDKNTPPVLFLGSAQPRFLAGRKDMISVLDKHGIYHETHIFKGAPHSFWLFEPWFGPTKNYVVNFLNRVFKTGN